MTIIKREIPPPPRTAVANVREARYDITEYVVHMTAYDGPLLEIIKSGAIKASFANMANVYSTTAKPTIRGPKPAVCFTEQPLWAIIDTMHASRRPLVRLRHRLSQRAALSERRPTSSVRAGDSARIGSTRRPSPIPQRPSRP